MLLSAYTMVHHQKQQQLPEHPGAALPWSPTEQILQFLARLQPKLRSDDLRVRTLVSQEYQQANAKLRSARADRKRKWQQIQLQQHQQSSDQEMPELDAFLGEVDAAFESKSKKRRLLVNSRSA